jgi:hypothetical protein
VKTTLTPGLINNYTHASPRNYTHPVSCQVGIPGRTVGRPRPRLPGRTVGRPRPRPPSPTDPVPAGLRTRHLARKLGISDEGLLSPFLKKSVLGGVLGPERSPGDAERGRSNAQARLQTPRGHIHHPLPPSGAWAPARAAAAAAGRTQGTPRAGPRAARAVSERPGQVGGQSAWRRVTGSGLVAQREKWRPWEVGRQAPEEPGGNGKGRLPHALLWETVIARGSHSYCISHSMIPRV